MPRYAAANFAAIDPEFRKANKIGSGGSKKGRYAYGKNDRVLVVSGRELLENGLCLRLMPLYDSSTVETSQPRLSAFREGPNNVAFGDWCRLWTAAHWVGNPGICFNIHDGNPNINLYESPLHVLRKVAYDSIKEHSHPTLGRLFSDLLAKNFVKDSHVGSLKKPEKTLYVSASIVTVDDNGQVVLSAFSQEERKNARILGLKTSAAEALHSALALMDDDGQYLSGDMLSLGPAKLFTILPESFKSGGTNVLATGPEGPATFQCPKYARGAKDALYVVGYPRSRSDYTHFGVLHDTYNGQVISLENYAGEITEDQQTMDDYLYLPTYEEQAEMLAPLFPSEALDYAWREFPEYLRAIPKNTATFTNPGVQEEEDEDVAPPAPRAVKAPSAPKVWQKPAADPPAPWDPIESSPEDEASVADMFSASDSAPPAGAETAPPPPPASAPAPAGMSKSVRDDILTRARSAAKAKSK
jgi:hypothetical protein